MEMKILKHNNGWFEIISKSCTRVGEKLLSKTLTKYRKTTICRSFINNSSFILRATEFADRNLENVIADMRSFDSKYKTFFLL